MPFQKGQPCSPKAIAILRARKGKTYEEIYGPRALEERQKRTDGNLGKQDGCDYKGSRAARKKISKARKGRTYAEIYGVERAAEECRKRSEARKKLWAGKPRKADVARPKHNASFEYKEWRLAVFQRDKYTCRRCKVRGGKLHGHHKKEWSTHPELRYVVSNGLTLCESCHRKEHKK